MLFASLIFPIILSCIGVSAFIIGAFIAVNPGGSFRDWAIIGGIPSLIVILILLVGNWDVREFRADKYDLDRLAADHNAVMETSEDEPYVFHSRFFKFEYWAYRIPNDDYSEYLITNNSVEDINNDE